MVNWLQRLVERFKSLRLSDEEKQMSRISIEKVTCVICNGEAVSIDRCSRCSNFVLNMYRSVICKEKGIIPKTWVYGVFCPKLNMFIEKVVCIKCEYFLGGEGRFIYCGYLLEQNKMKFQNYEEELRTWVLENCEKYEVLRKLKDLKEKLRIYSFDVVDVDELPFTFYRRDESEELEFCISVENNEINDTLSIRLDRRELNDVMAYVNGIYSKYFYEMIPLSDVILEVLKVL